MRHPSITPAAFLVLGLLAGDVCAQSPTVSLKAVRINPFCIGGLDAGHPCSRDGACESGSCNEAIEPTNLVSVMPGDVIECEIFASNWSPNGEELSVIQVSIEKNIGGVDNGGGVHLYDEPWRCNSDYECSGLSPFSAVRCCAALGETCPAIGICEMPPFHPHAYSMDLSRADYIFPQICIVESFPTPWETENSVRFADLLCAGTYGIGYKAPPKYVGTLRLAISDDACGLFRVRLRPSPETIFLSTYNLFIEPLIRQPLIIELPACVCSSIAEADPPDCSIEARQPTEPDGSSPSGPTSIDLRCAAGSADILSNTDFSAHEVPRVPFSLGIDDVVPDPDGRGADWVRVRFDRPVSHGSWGCVTLLASDQEFCVGHLPGDVNGDRVSDLADVDALLSCLADGDSACELEHCDLDRSGTCTSRDLLRLIDLLSGAGDYQPWLERTLSTCPSPP